MRCRTNWVGPPKGPHQENRMDHQNNPLSRATGSSRHRFVRRLGFGTFGVVIVLWAADVVSGLTPQQATALASRTAIVRPERECLYRFPESEVPEFRSGRRDTNLDLHVRNNPTNAPAPSGLEKRASVHEGLYKAWHELSKAVEGRHPSGRKITPEQAALRLLLLENIRDSAFKLPNRRR